MRNRQPEPAGTPSPSLSGNPGLKARCRGPCQGRGCCGRTRPRSDPPGFPGWSGMPPRLHPCCLSPDPRPGATGPTRRETRPVFINQGYLRAWLRARGQPPPAGTGGPSGEEGRRGGTSLRSGGKRGAGAGRAGSPARGRGARAGIPWHPGRR